MPDTRPQVCWMPKYIIEPEAVKCPGLQKWATGLELLWKTWEPFLLGLLAWPFLVKSYFFCLVLTPKSTVEHNFQKVSVIIHPNWGTQGWSHSWIPKVFGSVICPRWSYHPPRSKLCLGCPSHATNLLLQCYVYILGWLGQFPSLCCICLEKFCGKGCLGQTPNIGILYFELFR